MRFWWVNQNQTFEQETSGGYLWSPKRKSNGGINPFYEFMREVSPGDLVFSFQGTFIRAIGVIQSVAYSSPKPPEFRAAGPNWANIGWRVNVHYVHLRNQVQPSNHMPALLPHMQALYAPLQASGRGQQGVYLTFVTPGFAMALAGIIGSEATTLIEHLGEVRDVDSGAATDTASGLWEWENYLVSKLSADTSIADTERETLIVARRGQGKFKENVLRIEQRCRITKVDRIEHLRASHIRPWRDCGNHQQRLDGENGFLLTPTIDHLFDRGFISFENNGDLLLSPVAHRDSLLKMGIDPVHKTNVGGFTNGQKQYLDYHRDRVFLQAKVNQQAELL